MKIINEVRKDDNLYFCGAFWIQSDSFLNIQRGKFNLISCKSLCDYNGNIISDKSKNSQSHKNLWKNEIAKKFGCEELPFDYYPRGRVCIYNGVAFIHLNSKCNTPKIINCIIQDYELESFGNNIEIELNDEVQGSHYDFLLV